MRLLIQEYTMAVEEAGKAKKEGADGVAFSKEGDGKLSLSEVGCIIISPVLDGGYTLVTKEIGHVLHKRHGSAVQEGFPQEYGGMSGRNVRVGEGGKWNAERPVMGELSVLWMTYKSMNLWRRR